MYAVSEGDLPAIETILSWDKSAINARDEVGAGILTIALAFEPSNLERLIETLLKAGADPTVRDPTDNRLPHEDASAKNPRVYKLLVDA